MLKNSFNKDPIRNNQDLDIPADDYYHQTQNATELTKDIKEKNHLQLPRSNNLSIEILKTKKFLKDTEKLFKEFKLSKPKSIYPISCHLINSLDLQALYLSRSIYKEKTIKKFR